MTKQKNILGSKSIFGNMPDWNPAEIVGRIPRNLALSLFENPIPWTKKSIFPHFSLSTSNIFFILSESATSHGIKISESILFANGSTLFLRGSLWYVRATEAPWFASIFEKKIVTYNLKFNYF